MTNKKAQEDSAFIKIERAINDLIDLHIGDRSGLLGALSAALCMVASAMFGVAMGEAYRRLLRAGRTQTPPEGQSVHDGRLGLAVYHSEACLAAGVIAHALNEAWVESSEKLGVTLYKHGKLFMPMIQPTLSAARSASVAAVYNIAGWAGAHASLVYGKRAAPITSASAAMSVIGATVCTAPDVAATVTARFTPKGSGHDEATNALLSGGIRAAGEQCAKLAKGAQVKDADGRLNEEAWLPAALDTDRMMRDLADARPTYPCDYAPSLDATPSPDEEGVEAPTTPNAFAKAAPGVLYAGGVSKKPGGLN